MAGPPPTAGNSESARQWYSPCTLTARIDLEQDAVMGAQQRRTSEIIGELGFLLAVFGGMGTVVLQCTFWIQYGHWPAITIGESLRQIGIAKPQTDWGYAQTIVDWLYWQCPLSLVLFLLGLAIHTVFARRSHFAADRYRRPERLAKQTGHGGESPDAAHMKQMTEYEQQRQACGFHARSAQEEETSELTKLTEAWERFVSEREQQLRKQDSAEAASDTPPVSSATSAPTRLAS